ELEREVEAAPDQARIRGTVVEVGTETPVDGALVRFPGRPLTPLSAEGGAFTTYLFEPGDVALSLTHPDYEPGTCSATVPAAEAQADQAAQAAEERFVEVRCELVAKPKLGKLVLRIVSEGGAGLAGASVDLSGPSERTLVASPDGTLEVDGLPPGAYQVKV